MKNSFIVILVFVLILSFSGCSPSVPFLIKDYQIGKTARTSIGSPFLRWAVGNRSLNLSFSSNNQTLDTLIVFHSGDIINNPNGTLKEIIYKGVLDDRLQCVYREYLITDLGFGGAQSEIAKPIFFLDLVYDLKQTKIISFQDFVIRVESADQQQLEYTVINEPVIMSERPLRQYFKKYK